MSTLHEDFQASDGREGLIQHLIDKHGQPPMVQSFGDVQLARIHEEIHNGAAPAGRDTADGRW